MADSTKPASEVKILGSFAGIVGLLGVALYFSGWIYRWSYYSFFNLEVENLNLSSESFLFVPIQIFCNNLISFFTTIIAIVSIYFLSKITFFIGSKAEKVFKQRLSFLKYTKTLNHGQSLSKILIKDLVIVGWCILALFFISDRRGFIDARRDAIDSSSQLPVLTLVLPQNSPFGSSATEPFAPSAPTSDKFRVLGDIKRYTDLMNTELSEASTGKVWRLLAERDGSLYVFTTIPEKSNQDTRPIVLKIPENDEGLLILTSETSSL